MKKILLLFAAMICAVAGWAQSATNTVSATFTGDQLVVSLDNETHYIAFQMDIVLPDGVGVGSDAITLNEDRLDKNPAVAIAGATNSDFTIEYNVIDGNKLRVIAYNLQNREIAQQAGELFTVTLSAPLADDADVTITNVKFVNTNLLEEILASVKAELGVEDLDKLYDLDHSGEADIDDAMLIVDAWLAGTSGEHPEWDITKDGSVDIDDAMVIVDYWLNK